MTCTHRVVSQPVSCTAPAFKGDSAWPLRDETVSLRDIVLENGTQLDVVHVRIRLEGTIAPARDNVVLVVHALTGTPNASEWWKGVIGDGEVIDPRKHAVLCANLLGGCAGTSGPRSDDERQFPDFTTRDQALVLARVLDALGIGQPLLICGGSLGGMVTLEFAAGFPNRVRQAVVFAAPAAQTAQGLAWNAIMRRSIALGGADAGLALARMIGMLSYRTANSLESRFGRAKSDDGLFDINQWLSAHGDKLVQRFDAASYAGLIDAMDAHDVGRGRGSIAAALATVADRIIGVGVPGDILYTAQSVREWCTAAGASYRDLVSEHGHDAFLLETQGVSAVIQEALDRAIPVRRSAVIRLETGARTERPLRVALAGCGHVGSALLDLFGENTRADQRVLVTNVLVRDASRERPALARAIARGTLIARKPITNASQLFDGDADVLVELVGGTATAHSLVETALKRGIRVVTANKALLATHGPSLTKLAARYDTTLDYEGAVAAAVPVVRCLRAGAAGVGITRIAGIVNGTTNVVLDKLSAGESLADAIAFAQREGYAEADPTRDLSGEDAEDKLRVLAWLAFGVEPAALEVVRRGIDAETAAWAAQVAQQGDRVKLLATCYREGNALVAKVKPARVSAHDDWARVTGPGNRLVVESESAGKLVFAGPGAGGRATAGAVYGDLLHGWR